MADSAIRELLLVEALEEDECYGIDDDFMSDIESEDEENPVLKSVFISAVELSSFDDITNTFNVLCREQPRQSTHESSFFNTLRQSSDEEFASYFRMSRTAFQKLTNGLEAAAAAKAYKKIPLETKLLVTLWLLATSDSFRSVGDRFNMSKGTIHGIFVEIINSIASLASDFVKWPTKEERTRIAEKFQQKYSIPGVVGIIDCCRIYIKAPKESSEDCFNSKYFHSVVLQAVCDDKRIFRDLFIGGTGKVPCDQILEMSPIYSLISGNSSLLEPNEHLLGDSEYPVLSNLLTPLNDGVFNSQVISACSTSKRAFSLLKYKWRRLRYLDMGMKNFIPKVVAACCCLHNFVLNNENLGEIDAGDDVDHSTLASCTVPVQSLSSSLREKKRADIISSPSSQAANCVKENSVDCTNLHSYSQQAP